MSSSWYTTLVNQSASPYDGVSEECWKDKTRELINEHPLGDKDIVEAVITCWQDILSTRIGSGGHRIGVDIFPSPQIMAFFLHELIPLELQHRYPNVWRRDNSSDEKDVVHVPDDKYSFEIKASSSRNNIFGNRSYAQPSPVAKKHKAGYYLAINFGKFTTGAASPRITKIRIGWLDHTDWIGQRANTGQQARLSLNARDNKLLELFPSSE